MALLEVNEHLDIGQPEVAPAETRPGLGLTSSIFELARVTTAFTPQPMIL